MRATEWVIGVVALLLGIALAGFAMYGMGLNLLWSGSVEPRADAASPWWLWLLFPSPAVLMVAAGILLRRAGISVPFALAGAGVVGVLLGIGLLVPAYLSNR